MPKRRSNGRAVLRQFDHESFLYRVLRDLSAHADLGKLVDVLTRNPGDFRKAVASELSQAEQHRDNGGFIRYAVLRQVEACIKKNASYRPLTDKQCRDAALKKFWAAERRCARTNERLLHFSKYWSRAPLAGQILNDARSIISDAIGEFDAGTYREMFANAKVTNGSSFLEDRTMDLGLHAKLERTWSCTKECWPIVQDYLAKSPALAQYFLGFKHGTRMVPGDRVSFVPKNWDVHRSIAVQPSWNVFLQKGIDCVLKRKLLHVGVDLSDQTLNHVPAQFGSVDGSYATIDLSSASDTVSTELVRYLLPPSWFWILDTLRAKNFILNKEVYAYHKFSAMGNCNTFPLETLIFWAISKACLRYAGHKSGMLQVYGDDIVISRAVYPLVIEVLQYAGFEPNNAKCFAVGNFRETCGCDFVYGIDIRPVYIKKFPSNPAEVYNLYNRLLLNKLGIPFPSVLEYLLSCVERPHFGPCYALSSSEMQEWYAGKSVTFDDYFIAEPPEQRVWSYELMTYSYTFICLRRKSRRPRIAPRESTRKRVALLGLPFDVRATNRDRVVQEHRTVFHWPTLRDALTRITEARGTRHFWILTNF